MMRAAKWSVVILLAMVAGGCGGGSSKQPTVQVTGVVSLDGSPVEGATVIFGAASGQERGATGITDGSGRFKLTTYDKDDGAIAGKYTVEISKTETTGGMTPDEEHEAINAGKEVTPAVTVNKLPEKYSDGTKSGLTADVSAGGANDFKFELTSE
jgi:hypothetical protein